MNPTITWDVSTQEYGRKVVAFLGEAVRPRVAAGADSQTGTAGTGTDDDGTQEEGGGPDLTG